MVYSVMHNENQPRIWNHIIDSAEAILDCYSVSELAKGRPVYRGLFDENLTDETAWSGGLHIDDLIETSKKGRANGDFIMHRESKCLVDLKHQSQDEDHHQPAKITYLKVIYEKSRVVPVDGGTVLKFSKAELDMYSCGYRYLVAGQARLGHRIIMYLSVPNNGGFEVMYNAIDAWLRGRTPRSRWESSSDFKTALGSV
ncbi:hypothetical protein BDW68DRAFT_196513 [Aspergillus falconensis]